MKIILQTPGFKANRKLVDFVYEKVAVLGYITDRIVECRIVLKIEPSDTKDNKVSDIRLVIPGNDLFASRQSKTFEEAVSLTVDALKNPLSEWKKMHSGKINI